MKAQSPAAGVPSPFKRVMDPYVKPPAPYPPANDHHTNDIITADQRQPIAPVYTNGTVAANPQQQLMAPVHANGTIPANQPQPIAPVHNNGAITANQKHPIAPVHTNDIITADQQQPMAPVYTNGAQHGPASVGADGVGMGPSEFAPVGASKPATGTMGSAANTGNIKLPRNTCCDKELVAPDCVGPVLKLIGCAPDRSRLWFGSVLVVCRRELAHGLRLHIEDNGVQGAPLDPIKLGQYEDWDFLRWQISFEMLENERSITYWLAHKPAASAISGLLHPSSTSHHRSPLPQFNTYYKFNVPGFDQGWHWGFYSCSGFSNDVPEEDKTEKYGGVGTLWNDVLAQHVKNPFHCLVGAGDQLYNDDVFQLPSVQAWLAANDFTQRRAAQAAPEVEKEALAYYFHHYCVHFSCSPIQEIYATVPQVMTWDDHDIFDGWGSYPSDLQKCSVFQTIYEAAKKFYLLFQLQTNAQLAGQDGYFGVESYGTVVLLGSRVALALPDQRAERTHRVVMPMETHFLLLARLQSLPSSIRHVVFVATVPVVYPHLTGSHTMLKAFRDATRLPVLGTVLRKLGIAHMLLSSHDEPELLDDLRDHWEAPAHVEERRFLLEHLQMVARTKGVRVTLISGDVHLAGAGCTYSAHSKHLRPLNDFRYMPQIISSAIINAPPPDILVRALRLVARSTLITRSTRSKMTSIFTDHKRRKKLLNRRNWCEVWELGVKREVPSPPVSQPASSSQGVLSPGTLVFALRVEDFNKPPEGGLGPGNLKEYRMHSPVLNVRVPRRGQEGFYDREF